MQSNLTIPWNVHFAQQSKFYNPLLPFLSHFKSSWPTLQELNQTAQIFFADQLPCWDWVKFVDHHKRAMRYESQIYFKREVPTRLQNWHDFFNFCTWLQWPRTKIALNTRTVQEHFLRPEHKNTVRSSVQNRLALFDEGGIIITAEPYYLELIREQKWRELFIDNRFAFSTQITISLFGHALYEKLLNPYVGLTGNALLLPNSDPHSLDTVVASVLEDSSFFQKKSDLSPFPLLGVPSYYPANESFTFYENTQYFRSKKTCVTDHG